VFFFSFVLSSLSLSFCFCFASELLEFPQEGISFFVHQLDGWFNRNFLNLFILNCFGSREISSDFLTGCSVLFWIWVTVLLVFICVDILDCLWEASLSPFYNDYNAPSSFSRYSYRIPSLHHTLKLINI